MITIHKAKNPPKEYYIDCPKLNKQS